MIWNNGFLKSSAIPSVSHMLVINNMAAFSRGGLTGGRGFPDTRGPVQQQNQSLAYRVGVSR